MKLSREGAAFILAHEAIVLEAYRDAAGIWTIGAGHTAAAGGLKPVAGMRITLDQAVKIFMEDVKRFEAGVLKAMRVPLRQHEFDALVSFHFNTGAISTGSVDDKLNRGDKSGAIATLRQYVKSGGKELQGLKDRREQEAAMFQRGEYFPRAVAVHDRYPGAARSVDWRNLPWPDEPAVTPVAPPPVPDLPDPPPADEDAGKVDPLVPFLLLAGIAALVGIGLLVAASKG